MKKFIKKIKSNKFLYILSVLIVGVFFILIARVTYAFLAPIINNAQTNIVIKGDTVDEFKLKVGNPLKLDATPTTLKENGTNYTTSTTATASLKANSTKNTATYNYYLYFEIDNNTFTYTSGTTPEIILTITNPNGEEVTSIEGLTYGTFNGVSGFDVTTQNGLFNITNNYSITSNSSSTFTNQVWNITLTYLNLPIDQSGNFGKSMEVGVLLQKEEMKTLLADYIKSLYVSNNGENGIYYHDASLANGAGDNSYRYAGANPNNYVCFGSNESTCPTDNLYRIIGVFRNQVKLIKYDYATSALLGTDGDYYNDANSAGMPTDYYKGTIDMSSVGIYYWNNSTRTSTWSESLLNKTNLNTNFINNIGTEWANKIATTTWKVGGNTYANISQVVPSVAYQNEIVNPVTTNTTDNATEYSAKIGLMYVSDYMYAAPQDKWTLVGYNSDASKDYRAATSVNWMYMGLHEWTISRVADFPFAAFRVYYDGGVRVTDVNGNFVKNSRTAVRPSFNLWSSITYVSGSGSASDPMVIN
mgnify:CR=1 FL=1